MATNTVNGVAEESMANAEDKALNTTDNFPPVTKEPAATEAATAPSVTEGSNALPTADSTADPKPEPPASAAVEEDSAKVTTEDNKPAVQPDKPSESSPNPVAQPVVAEIDASGTSAGATEEPSKEPSKAVAVEETDKKDQPSSKQLASEESAKEVPKDDSGAPVAKTDADTTKVPATESSLTGDDAAAAGSKRKAEEPAKVETESIKNENTDAPEKKSKINGAAAVTTNGAARKPGRPRKDKTVTAPIGKTARKTRSQGAAD